MIASFTLVSRSLKNAKCGVVSTGPPPPLCCAAAMGSAIVRARRTKKVFFISERLKPTQARGESHPGDQPGAVAERVLPRVDPVEDRQMEIRDWGRLPQLDVLASFERAVATAHEDRRQRVTVMSIAVRHVRAVQEHRVIQARA